MLQAAEKEASNLQKEVDKAADHIAKLADKVKKAETGQAEAQHKLASAGVEASTARKLVEAVGILKAPLFVVCGRWVCLGTFREPGGGGGEVPALFLPYCCKTQNASPAPRADD